jgi:hypothetical protein
MNRNSLFSRVNLILICVITFGFILSSTGCDSGDVSFDSPESVPVLSLDDIEFVNTTPAVGKNGQSEYQLEIGIRPAPWRSRIRGLHMIARAKDQEPYLLTDDGSGSDRAAKDGVYSARIPADCLPVTGDGEKRGPSRKDIDIECKIKFVGPGEVCTDWGECPSRVERSLLWGLIKYETDIVVCFCLEDCTISF